MQINFIAQPQEQLGIKLEAALSALATPTAVTIVSAFASLQAILRLKSRLYALHDANALVRIIVGIDMGGTSKEVLQELATWPIEVFVFKNKKSGVTFHPKLYIVESVQSAEIFIGSNNLTDGGLYGNYEGTAHVSYNLPADFEVFTKAKEQLSKFIEPVGPVGRRLDQVYLELLIARADIPSDAEARLRRKLARYGQGGRGADLGVFGFESTNGPPVLPIEVQRVVMAAVRNQLSEIEEVNKKARKKRVAAVNFDKEAEVNGDNDVQVEPLPEIDISRFVPIAQIAPTAFYLELTATTGAGAPIPGEQRIPLEAINSAQEFWMWPDNYERTVNPRKGPDASGDERVYLSWKPIWRVRSVHNLDQDVVSGVRMYFYENSSDFRFYSGKLKTWARAGDIVRIVRCDNEDYVYDCALAVAGTPEHEKWRALCTAGSERSPRVFGFS